MRTQILTFDERIRLWILLFSSVTFKTTTSIFPYRYYSVYFPFFPFFLDPVFFFSVLPYVSGSGTGSGRVCIFLLDPDPWPDASFLTEKSDKFLQMYPCFTCKLVNLCGSGTHFLWKLNKKNAKKSLVAAENPRACLRQQLPYLGFVSMMFVI